MARIENLHSTKLMQHPLMCLRSKRESPGTNLVDPNWRQPEEIYLGGGYASLNK